LILKNFIEKCRNGKEGIHFFPKKMEQFILIWRYYIFIILYKLKESYTIDLPAGEHGKIFQKIATVYLPIRFGEKSGKEQVLNPVFRLGWQMDSTAGLEGRFEIIGREHQ
jgi:hypothetical protein